MPPIEKPLAGLFGIQFIRLISLGQGRQACLLYTSDAADLDANGVGIAHIRGALCDANNNVQYTLGGTATVGGCFYELLDGPGRG